MQTAEIFLNNLDARLDEPELKIVDIFICKLRKRLNEVKGDETHIQTAWARVCMIINPIAESVLSPQYSIGTVQIAFPLWT